MSEWGSWNCSNGSRKQRERTEGNGGCMYLLTFIMKLELKPKKRKASNDTEQGCDKSLTGAPHLFMKILLNSFLKNLKHLKSHSQFSFS